MKTIHLPRIILIISALFIILTLLFIVYKKQSAYSDDLYSKSQIDAILSQSWNGYKNSLIQNGKVVRLDQGGDTVSEGQAYAMLRAVYMNDKGTFDSTWSWTQANLSRMNNPNTKDRDHLFAWDYKDHVLDWSSATDADEDIALSLVFANHTWGDASYLSSAKDIMNDMLSRDTIKASDGKSYITGGSYGIYEANPDINPSYLSPASYKVFASASGNSVWNTIADTSYYILQQSQSDKLDTGSGLFPNWVSFNPQTLEVTPINQSDRNTDYTYDAFRTPFRIALDKLWFNDSRANQLLSGKINTFFNSELQKNGKIYAEYHHDGSVKNAYESSAIYGGDIAVFVADQSLNDIHAIESKIIADFHNNNGSGYFGKQNGNYYGNNWAWFGLLMANDEATDIANASAPAATTQTSTTTNTNGMISQVIAKKAYTISFTINAKNLPQSYLVDVELKDKNNNKVSQAYIDNLTDHSENKTISVSMPTDNLPAGAYTIEVGIFTSGWSQLYNWIGDVGSLSIS